MDPASFRAIIQSLGEGWRQRDYASVIQHFALDLQYVDPLRYSFTNREALERFFQDDAGCDQTVEWHTVLFDTAEQAGVVEYTYQGTCRYHGAAIVRVSAGKITHWREYQHIDDRSWVAFMAGP